MSGSVVITLSALLVVAASSAVFLGASWLQNRRCRGRLMELSAAVEAYIREVEAPVTDYPPYRRELARRVRALLFSEGDA